MAAKNSISIMYITYICKFYVFTHFEFMDKGLGICINFYMCMNIQGVR